MPRSNAGPIALMSSDFGATIRQGAWSDPHEAADHSWEPTLPWRGTGTVWFVAGFRLSRHLGRGTGWYRRRRRYLPDCRGHQRQSPHLRALAACGIDFPTRLSAQARPTSTGDPVVDRGQGEVPVDLALGPRPRPITHRYSLHAGNRRMGRQRTGVVASAGFQPPRTRSRL